MVYASFPDGFYLALGISYFSILLGATVGYWFRQNIVFVFLGGIAGVLISILIFPSLVTTMTGCGCKLMP